MAFATPIYPHQPYQHHSSFCPHHLQYHHLSDHHHATLPSQFSKNDLLWLRRRKSRRRNMQGHSTKQTKSRWEMTMKSSTSFQKRVGKWINDNVLLGIKPSPELSAILTVYFIQGALGISRLAL